MQIESLQRTSIVNIDFPSYHPNIFRLDGQLATGFFAIKELIDRAKLIGFEAVSFDTNVPIDVRSGSILTELPGGSNRIGFFEEVWQGIEYAESIGLKTVIDLNIRNGLNDAVITTSNILPTLDLQNFFNSVKKYETNIASRAQHYGVDGITIGAFNFGFDTKDYQSYWAEIVSSIRQVYKGTLRYSSHEYDVENPIWKLVDEIQISIDPKWNLQSNFNADDFVDLYLGSYLAGNKTLSEFSIDSRIKQFLTEYPNKSIGLEIMFQPGQSAGNEFINPWGYVHSEENPLLENSNDQKNLKIFEDKLIDVRLNQKKIEGFFEYFGNYLKNNISNIQYWQYAPWAEAEWLRKPETFENKVWASVKRAGPSLNWNPEAEETLKFYLNREWGFTTLHYDTTSNDQLIGSEINDKFYSGGGQDIFYGKSGIDSVIFQESSAKFNLSKIKEDWIVTKQYSVDQINLIDIEQLIFTDKAIRLDIDGVSATAYRIYRAAFNRTPDIGGLGYWIDQMDKGMDVVAVAARFIDSPEFKLLYGNNIQNLEFITKIYNNVLDRNADASGLAWWANEMKTNPAKSWQKVLADFSESTENQANVASLIANGITYDPWIN